MSKDEEAMREYLSKNGLGSMGAKRQYVDPDIQAWYKANKIYSPINVLKDTKMKERIKELKGTISAKGRKELGLGVNSDKGKNTVGADGNKSKMPPEKKKEMQEYLDKLTKLHEEKMKTYNDQIKNHKLIPTDKELILMVKLQQEINKGRDKYEREYGTEELNKLMNKNFSEEKKEEKEVLNDHQKKIDELEKLNNDLDKVLGEIEILEYQMSKGQISVTDYDQKKEMLQKEKIKTLWDINKMNPEILAEEEKQLSENEKYKTNVLGETFEKEQKKDLNIQNTSKFKENNEIKDSQKEEIGENKQEIEKRQKVAIDNKEQTIEDIKVKIATTTDENEIIEMTEQVAGLENDIDISKEQERAVTSKEDIGYMEFENGIKPEQNYAKELESAMIDFKDVIEQQDNLTEDKLPKARKEENPFILQMQKGVIDINDENAAKKHIETIERITSDAKAYNKDLEKSGDAPETK